MNVNGLFQKRFFAFWGLTWPRFMFRCHLYPAPKEHICQGSIKKLVLHWHTRLSTHFIHIRPGTNYISQWK